MEKKKKIKKAIRTKEGRMILTTKKKMKTMKNKLRSKREGPNCNLLQMHLKSQSTRSLRR